MLSLAKRLSREQELKLRCSKGKVGRAEIAERLPEADDDIIWAIPGHHNFNRREQLKLSPVIWMVSKILGWFLS